MTNGNLDNDSEFVVFVDCDENNGHIKLILSYQSGRGCQVNWGLS